MRSVQQNRAGHATLDPQKLEARTTRSGEKLRTSTLSRLFQGDAAEGRPLGQLEAVTVGGLTEVQLRRACPQVAEMVDQVRQAGAQVTFA